jgi:uncharacterized protein (DUF305 family)
MSYQEQNLDDQITVLPWWQNPLNFIALGLSMLILGAGIGYYLGDSSATPDKNKVDIGFLQDMRYHHDQAVQMAYYYRTSVADSLPRLDIIAEEILLSQQLESGRMVQLLRSFGEIEANDTGTAMGWMGHAMPIDEMDGLASQAELDSLAAATGDEASKIFATLMINHHNGGIAMAKYAIENASNNDVINMAKSMVKGQQAEVGELQAILDSLG